MFGSRQLNKNIIPPLRSPIGWPTFGVWNHGVTNKIALVHMRPDTFSNLWG